MANVTFTIYRSTMKVIEDVISLIYVMSGVCVCIHCGVERRHARPYRAFESRPPIN